MTRVNTWVNSSKMTKQGKEVRKASPREPLPGKREGNPRMVKGVVVPKDYISIFK
jgi:hypothetical protein